MTIFDQILEICSISSHHLHNVNAGKQTDRGTIIQKLARQLVLEHVHLRFYNLKLPRKVRINLARVLVSNRPETSDDEAEKAKTQKTYLSCQTKRKSTYRCYSCENHICLQCTKQACPNCA